MTQEEITAALIEWRQARKEFLAMEMPKDLRVPPAIWNRLAEAERNLMRAAEHLDGGILQQP